MTYYAGLDVSLRTVNICVIDDEGKLVAEAKLASYVQDIVAYLDELNLNISSIAIDAGTLTQYMTYGLHSADFEVVCMEARQVKAAPSTMRNKTDKHNTASFNGILTNLSPGPLHPVSRDTRSQPKRYVKQLSTPCVPCFPG